MSDTVATNQEGTIDHLADTGEAQAVLSDNASKRVVDNLVPLAAFVLEKFNNVKMIRTPRETVWANAYRNYLGQWSSSSIFMDTEISKAFIKITKTKVLASYGQLLDIVFSNGDLPIKVSATPEPLGVAEALHISPEDPVSDKEKGPPGSPLGFPGDGNDLKPGETMVDRAGAFFKRMLEGAKFKEGYGKGQADLDIKPAEKAAALMNKRIHDQLVEGEASTAIRQAAFEMVLLGTGVLKGPFNFTKEFPRWAEDGAYVPVVEEMPKMEYVSIWDFYIDPEARTLSDADWVIQRRKMSRSQLLALKKQETYRKSAIDHCITMGPNYNQEGFEQVLNTDNETHQRDRWEVLDYWGNMDVAKLKDLDVTLPIPEGVDEVQVNVWICGDQLLRVIINPFTPKRLPYMVCPYEFNPYNPHGVGVPENMEDTQMLMNGFIRLAVDNAVLSGSLMLEVDDALMVSGQSYKVKAGKFFHKNSGTGVSAITPIKIQNTAPQNIQMFDVARRLSDEATGIPSFSHGMTGVQGVGRTASGIRDLMGAANISQKTVIKNMDDFWFAPMGRAYFAWNMQFKFDKKLLGDLSVEAKGTSYFLEREDELRSLLQTAQVVMPTPAVNWLDWKAWLEDVVVALRRNPDRLVNNPEMAQLQSMLIQMQGQVQGGSPPNLGPGAGPAAPGQQGFTGTPQQQGVGGTQPAPTQQPVEGI